MKTLLLILVSLALLGGCVVVPAGPDYGYYGHYGDRYAPAYPYAYPGYPYRYGPYYRHRHSWREAP